MVLGGYWVGYRYSTLPTPPSPHLPRVHPSPCPPGHTYVGAAPASLKVAVGLKSVRQLSLSLHFSGLRGMTELYNLVRIDNR